jgi:hypothetical protein
MVWPGGAAYGINGSNGGRFMVIGGGLPIVNANGEVIGGVSFLSFHDSILIFGERLDGDMVGWRRRGQIGGGVN